MFLFRCVLLILFLSVATRTAAAGIMISIDNASVTPGDTFLLDVRVQGEMGYDNLTERLDFLVGVFRITPVGLAPEGGVTFDNSQVNSFDNDPDYVFFNNTFGLTRDVTMFATPGDTLTLTDGTFDFLGVDVTTDFLLARLELTVDPALLDFTQYQVSLVEAESEFLNEAFESISFSSSGGLITINGLPSAAAVPEPSSLLVCLFLAAGLLRRTQKR